nr:hypothetical protein [Tanacetum cinerariifolium]
QEIKAPQPSSPPHTNVADEATSTGVNVRYGGATTTVTSLDAGHGSGNINKTSSMPDDSPLPRVHTLGSDEGIMKHNELMDLVTKLLDRVVALETDLKHTQKFYGATYTKLIMKVKKLEKTVKTSQARRKAKIVVSDDKEDLEDPSKQERKIDEIDQDPNILLIQHVSTTGASITTASVDVSPISSTRRVSIADDITMAETLVYIRRSASKEKAQSFSKKEWENIRARVEANEELTQRLQEEENNKYNEVDQENMVVDLINPRKRYFATQKAKANQNKPMTQAQQRNYMSKYIKHIGSHTLHQVRRYSFDKLKTLFETTMRRVNTFVPMETEDRGRASELAVGRSQATIADYAKVRSSKRAAEAKLDYEGSKKQKTNEASGSEQPDEEENELSQEDLQQ